MANKRIGILTFHASHNYGSCLQAYALKTYLSCKYKNCTFEIVNFIGNAQKELYLNCYHKRDLKSLYSRIFLVGHRKDIEGKTRRFNNFINDYLTNTANFSNFNKFNELRFDAIVCGSDQIWNVFAKDFHIAYLLPNFHGKKYAFSPSLGPAKNSLSSDQFSIFSKYIPDFRMISVRDSFSQNQLKTLVDAPVTCDPTMLLDVSQWNSLSSRSLIDFPKRPYIFFYDLSRNKDNYLLAHRIGKILSLPIVISNVPFPRVIKYSKVFEKKYDSGPLEFLNYIKHATLVLTSSFHGTVFSLLFRKEFYVLNGLSDNRIIDLLKDAKMVDRSISKDNFDYSFNPINYQDRDFEILKRKIQFSKDFLSRIIDDI